MGHKILVAFDESENAKRAVDYIAQVFPRDAEITLFSVLQDSAAICEMNSPELTPYFKSQKNAFCWRINENVGTKKTKTSSMLQTCSNYIPIYE